MMNKDFIRVLEKQKQHLLTWQEKTLKQLEKNIQNQDIAMQARDKFYHRLFEGAIFEVSFTYYLKKEPLFSFIFFYQFEKNIFKYDLSANHPSYYSDHLSLIGESLEVFTKEIKSFQQIPAFRLQFLMNETKIFSTHSLEHFRDSYTSLKG